MSHDKREQDERSDYRSKKKEGKRTDLPQSQLGNGRNNAPDKVGYDKGDIRIV
jgi:hypothetical protein